MSKLSIVRRSVRKLSLASVAVLAGAWALPASAQDGAPERNWSGMYVGGLVGYVRQRADVDAAFANQDFSSRFDGGSETDFGGMLGGRVGYNFQSGRGVLGIAVEANSLFGESASTKLDGYSFCNGDCVSASESNYAITGRLDGLASFPISLGFVTRSNELVYVRGGYALASIEFENDVFPNEESGNRVVGGYNVGVGFSKFATENISVFLEGNYYRFDDIENRLTRENFTNSTSMTPSLMSVSVGINIHF